MTGPARSLEVAWNEALGLRMTRWTGTFEVPDIVEAVKADPTVAHMPCPSLVDLRGAHVVGSVAEFQGLAVDLDGFVPDHGDAYAYLVSDDATGAIATFAARQRPAWPAVKWFRELAAALDHLGISNDDYTATEALFRVAHRSA